MDKESAMENILHALIFKLLKGIYLLYDWQPGMEFMYDNSRIQIASKIEDWLHENDIPLLGWPPYSLNLNPW